MPWQQNFFPAYLRHKTLKDSLMLTHAGYSLGELKELNLPKYVYFGSQNKQEEWSEGGNSFIGILQRVSFSFISRDHILHNFPIFQLILIFKS